MCQVLHRGSGQSRSAGPAAMRRWFPTVPPRPPWTRVRRHGTSSSSMVRPVGNLETYLVLASPRVNVFGHCFSFRSIYALWNTLPISLRQPTRGRGSSTANKDRLDKHLEAKKEARAFTGKHALLVPTTKQEWLQIFREMGRFLATKTFLLVHNPTPVMELPIQPIHDSKEHLRFRAICDERITIPLESLRRVRKCF